MFLSFSLFVNIFVFHFFLCSCFLALKAGELAGSGLFAVPTKPNRPEIGNHLPTASIQPIHRPNTSFESEKIGLGLLMTMEGFFASEQTYFTFVSRKCNQVYDETCSTVYVPHCAYEK